MLGARAETDETGGELPENWKPYQQTSDKRQGLAAARHSPGDDSAMNNDLHALDQARRPFATRLHLSQVVHRNRSALQFFREQVRRRDRILNGEINPNAARWRHGVRRITDAKQSFTTPIAQTIDLDGEQFDFRPVVQFCYAVAQKSGKADNVLLKLRQPTRFDLIEAAFGDDETGLRVIAAIE